MRSQSISKSVKSVKNSKKNCICVKFWNVNLGCHRNIVTQEGKEYKHSCSSRRKGVWSERAGEAPMSPEAEAPPAHQWNHPVLRDKGCEPGAEREVTQCRFGVYYGHTFFCRVSCLFHIPKMAQRCLV